MNIWNSIEPCAANEPGRPTGARNLAGIAQCPGFNDYAALNNGIVYRLSDSGMFFRLIEVMELLRFIRPVNVPSTNGTMPKYIRIVGSARENGRVKQKVIANLGKRDNLEMILPMLNRSLRGDKSENIIAQIALLGSIEPLDTSTWWLSLVVRHF